jgi:hypothetical protein
MLLLRSIALVSLLAQDRHLRIWSRVHAPGMNAIEGREIGKLTVLLWAFFVSLTIPENRWIFAWESSILMMNTLNPDAEAKPEIGKRAIHCRRCAPPETRSGRCRNIPFAIQHRLPGTRRLAQQQVSRVSAELRPHVYA